MISPGWMRFKVSASSPSEKYRVQQLRIEPDPREDAGERIAALDLDGLPLRRHFFPHAGGGSRGHRIVLIADRRRGGRRAGGPGRGPPGRGGAGGGGGGGRGGAE